MQCGDKCKPIGKFDDHLDIYLRDTVRQYKSVSVGQTLEMTDPV